MLVISVLNQKGGVGKTTLATNLAAGLSKNNSVVLVDSDPQGSARDWKQAGTTKLPVIGLDRATIAQDLPAVANAFDIAVIDGAPQIRDLAISAIKASDVILIPVQPSPYDIWASAELVDLIKDRQEMTSGKPKAAFIISRAIKNTKLGGEVAAALESFELPVFKASTTQRVAYPTSASEGKSVFESEDEAAKNEITAIIDELENFL